MVGEQDKPCMYNWPLNIYMYNSQIELTQQRQNIQ